MSAFTFRDGERLIRFGSGAAGEATALLEQRGFRDFALLTTERAAAAAPEVTAAAGVVLHVPSGGVPDAAAAVRGEGGGRPLVALGGGRVVDSAKAIGGADGLEVAAIPTTLSGAELTPFHRMPAGVDEFRLVRPSLVIADPALMASQPGPDLAASAMNALAHAVEALYTPAANPVAEGAALRAVAAIAHGLGDHDDPDREQLALGGVLAGWASGVAGYAVHHVLCQTTVRVAGTPHARTNAVMLPHSLRLMEPRVPELLAKVAVALGVGKPSPALASARVAHYAARCGATRLSVLGVGEAHLDEIASAAAGRAELQNTPDAPDEDELRDVLAAAM